MDPLQLTKEFIVLSPEQKAITIRNSAEVFQQLDQRFNNFVNHQLISCFEFTSNWPSWEQHPKGDEIVLLMQGQAKLIFDINGQHQETQLTQAGQYIIVPAGTWHTAHIQDYAKMLFITPGEDTQNKAI